MYRSIRQRALIFGLPVSLFALQMVVVICSLMIIIFSFGPLAILGLALFNLGLYLVLLRLSRNPHVFTGYQVFPKSISNQQTTSLSYEAD